jgi:hypothetical protein
MVDLRGGEQQVTMRLTFGAGLWVFGCTSLRKGLAKFEEGGCPCEPVEEDEPLHVWVDKAWDPDPLVALAIPVGLALLEDAPEIFMSSMSDEFCPHKIGFSRR